MEHFNRLLNELQVLKMWMLSYMSTAFSHATLLVEHVLLTNQVAFQ